MRSEKTEKMAPIRARQRHRCRSLQLTFALVCGFALALCIAGIGRSQTQPAGQQSESSGVRTANVHFTSADGSMDAFLATPDGTGKHPAVVVIHDIRGLDANTQEIARRFAEAGFVALAPDFLSHVGGTRNKTPEEVTQEFGKLSINGSIEDAKAAFDFLARNPGVDAGKISSVGIGWGGWRTFKMAEDLPTLYRAVVFYGATPAEISDDALHRIHAPVLAHYAQYDFKITGNYLWTQKQLGKIFTYYIYPETSRGFFQEGTSQYNAEAAKQAWSRTLDFMRPRGNS